MAEVQTISAAFDLARLAWGACVFLKKVKDADRTSAEIYERATRLNQVLNGLTLTLQNREQKGVAPHDEADQESAVRIRRCILASGIILKEVERKVGGFDNDPTSGTAILDRVKIALRHPGIVRLQTDLDARVQALQTELSILQLSDQAHTHATIGTNHREVLDTLTQLKEQVDSGHKLLYSLLLENHKLSKFPQSVSPQDVEEALVGDGDDEKDAIESLKDCISIAEELHERLTTKYEPDDRSIRFQRYVVSEQDKDSSFVAPSPFSEPSESLPWQDTSGSLTNVTSTDVPEDEENDADRWPLTMLNGHIDAFQERATKEREQGHYNQAEINLQAAIRFSEMRERQHSVPFDDRVKLHEEVAVLYQNQQKWGEAVSKMNQLLRDSSDELVKARQNQVLASIYYDRHMSKSGPALSNMANDAETAEKHGRRAFNKRYMLLESDDLPEKEIERHNSCTALLIRILETLDKTVEANELVKHLSASDVATTIGTNSLRHPSTNHLPNDFVIIEDKNELLVKAIRAGESETALVLIADEEVNLEQLCREGKTPLMHAVEMSDETIVHKLLDPGTREGADVSTTNKKGITALHLAASEGLHDMVRCLLHHDAEIEAKDKRGETPLMKAVQNDQATIVQILSDAGADLDTRNADEWSLLHFAIRLPKTTMTNQLLDIAPDVRDAIDQAGKTALHHCAELERINQATALLTHKNRLDVNAIDSVSRSPLHFPTSLPPTPRRESLVRLLVENGARVDFSGGRALPRMGEYAALRPFLVPRRASRISRHDSISTTGTIDTTSSSVSKLSRKLPFFSRSTR